jgi:hypothetical protein
MATATHAQQVVVWHDDFNSATLGANSAAATYGAVSWNFQGAGIGNPVVTITNNNLLGTNTQNCAFTVDTTQTNLLNFGWQINYLPASGNTNTSLRAYTLEFDIAVQGVDFTSLGAYVAPTVAVFANPGGLYYGSGCMSNPPLSIFPSAGTGYQHVSMPLSAFDAAHDTLLVPTNTPLAFSIGFYMAAPANTPFAYQGIEEIDLQNVQLLMTNPPPLPPPTAKLVLAKPGLRIFAQDHTFTYNQEGFGTVDLNQSWVGVATPANPVSYSITFADFDTVNNYTLYAQFAQGADPGNPFGVYGAQNAFVWSITHQDSGFTTSIDWKTNRPSNGVNNNALALTTTTTTGRGTWRLTFTNNIDGTVTAPDGTTGSFTLDPAVSADFANPLTIDFGTAPNNTGGYGQWIDLSRIAITNVIDGNEFDDFTQDQSLNTSLWNPGFSYNPGSVIQVSTTTPCWVNWTVPDEGFGLATKASLKGGTNVWFSPNYYGNGAFMNTTPTVMGGSLSWTLIPAGCLPTVDGTQGGTPSLQGFFRLSSPPPSQ